MLILMLMRRHPIHPLLHKIHSSLKIFITACVIAFFFCAPSAHAQMEVLKDLYERAINAFNSQQYQQAIDCYQQIIKMAPTFAPAYNGMALANQAASGDEDKTIQYLKTAISYDPKLTQAYDNLGRIYYGREDIVNAEIYFNKALVLDPTLTSAALSLAWINLLAKSKPITALRYFKIAVVQKPSAKTYYGMGQAYFASNQRPEAMEMITKLYDMGEDDMASQLEKSLRENKGVNTDSDANSTANANTNTQPVGLGPLTPTADKPTGMKVHLSGKLSDY